MSGGDRGLTSPRVINKVHQKVADALGMAMVEPDDETGDELVPMPESTDLVPVDNPELPIVDDEMTRLEHAQRQTDFLLDHALPVVEQSLAKTLTMPPIYAARAVEANAKLLEAVHKLAELKASTSMKLIELKMKMAAFTRNKGQVTPTITNSTFVFNREEMIRAYKAQGDDAD